MTDDLKKLPRLYCDAPLDAGLTAPLSPDQLHYFKTVMRRADGDAVRVFNGRDGEWRATLRFAGKRDGALDIQGRIAPQQPAPAPVHLIFAPIKKTRMDMMIEKAVELGATALHPVLTANTEVRSLNTDRVTAQMIEACEQCERMDIPVLHDPLPLDRLLGAWSGPTPILAALERHHGAAPLPQRVVNGTAAAILIGPEGGFTATEAALIAKSPAVTPVSLGPRILRAETAAIYALSCVLSQNLT